MARQKIYYKRKPNKVREFFVLLLRMIIFPFTKYFWYKKIEDSSPFFSYGSSYCSSWEFRWQRVFNLIILALIIMLFFVL